MGQNYITRFANLQLLIIIILGFIQSVLMQITTVECGYVGTPCYRMYFKNEYGFISPFHDIPLTEDNKGFNMVVEIPRNTQEKMEVSNRKVESVVVRVLKVQAKYQICKDNLLNPIKQDITKDGQMRIVQSPYPHNYGALPQTWESPHHKDPHTQCIGDNDPIDVIEIGSKVAKRGEVLKVKVLGIFALIDEGETDWKVIAIDVTDANAEHFNDVNDVKCKHPGLLEKTMKWFTDYKAPHINTIGLNGQFENRNFAVSVINTTNCYWKELIKNNNASETNNINCENVSIDGSPFQKTSEEIKKDLPLACRT